MRILVFSDIIKWNGQEELANQIKPDVIILAGDLTSDGRASFWHDAVDQIPAFRTEAAALFETLDRSQELSAIEALWNLAKKYHKSEAFLKIRKEIHVDRFYSFLRSVGKKYPIFVIKGDHDEDFEGDYSVKQINNIEGCTEISGSCASSNGITFLGLGYQDTKTLTALDKILYHKQIKPDVLVAHCGIGMLRELRKFGSKLIIRGHSGYGKYLVEQTPTVLTGERVYYTEIEIASGAITSISQHRKLTSGGFDLIKDSLWKPYRHRRPAIETYDWLKHYPDNKD